MGPAVVFRSIASCVALLYGWEFYCAFLEHKEHKGLHEGHKALCSLWLLPVLCAPFSSNSQQNTDHSDQSSPSSKSAFLILITKH